LINCVNVKKLKKTTYQRAMENLTLLISKSGKTQKEIAEEVGVMPSAVSHWVKGKRPIPENRLERLAKALECAVEDITGQSATEAATGALKTQYPAEVTAVCNLIAAAYKSDPTVINRISDFLAGITGNVFKS